LITQQQEALRSRRFGVRSAIRAEASPNIVNSGLYGNSSCLRELTGVRRLVKPFFGSFSKNNTVLALGNNTEILKSRYANAHR
jgi:hypothetical protein